MAFVEGIGFLCLSIFLLFLYALAGYYVVFLLQALFRLLWFVQNGDGLKGDSLPWWPRRFALIAFSAIFVYHLALYTSQRFEWMGEDNAHLNAKEYWAAGSPLYVVRIAAARYTHPDIPVFGPLHQLQQAIYDRGVRHLPEGDGEIGVWTDLWFCYPYLLTFREPYGTDVQTPSPAMRQLLDKVWFSIETMASKPMADTQMKRQHYARNLPRSMFYYLINRGYYEDNQIRSRPATMRDPEQLRRFRAIANYQQELHDYWVGEGLFQPLLETAPKLEATRLTVANIVYMDLIVASIYSRTFRCDDPVIERYLAARKAFGGDAPDGDAWRRLHKREPQAAETLFIGAIDYPKPSFMKILLTERCDFEVPVEERFYLFFDKEFNRKQLRPKVRSIFRDEWKLLEEGVND